MNLWAIAGLSGLLGAISGLAQLLSSRRALTARIVFAVLLNAGLSACAAAYIALEWGGLKDNEHAIRVVVPLAILSGYSGAPVVSRIVELLQRIQLRSEPKE